ncbi:hypothetical protein [Bacillus sp. USDA818B3_A]|uniref:hypothetical protein n=1 Tax=Bacillus sp. USDA818B3_A TaxID=2698834 RepID=UPI00136EE5EE|nr:hypothetical protein [Bacillus sp. USDA818B3_A]
MSVDPPDRIINESFPEPADRIIDKMHPKPLKPVKEELQNFTAKMQNRNKDLPIEPDQYIFPQQIKWIINDIIHKRKQQIIPQNLE